MDDEFQETLSKLYLWFISQGREFDFIPEEDINSELAMAFLLKSEEDFHSSKILYRKRIYRDSLIHVQQGVEKLGKSILLISGISSEEEMRRPISHNFSKYIFNKTKKLFSSFGNFMGDKTYTDLAKRIEQYQSKYHKKEPTLETFNISNLKTFGQTYKSYTEKIFSFADFLKQVDIYNILQEDLSDFLKPIIEVEEERRNQKVSNKEKELLEKQLGSYFQDESIKFLGINTLLTYVQLSIVSIFSALIEPHFEKARYPENSEIIYSKKNEIVSILPDIRKITTNLISDFYYLISLNNPEI